LLAARVERLLAPVTGPTVDREPPSAWPFGVTVVLLGIAATADHSWLAVHSATEVLVRFLP
jgi:hypothetical protein